MSVTLSFQYDSWRETLVTHTLGEWLVVGALVIYFIAKLREGNTILTLLVRLMFTLTLCFQLREECLKAFVLHKFVFFITLNAIRALLKRTMIATVLNLLDIFFSNAEAVDALSIRTMIAMSLFDLLISKWSLFVL
jgi:hypothetical protein